MSTLTRLDRLLTRLGSLARDATATPFRHRELIGRLARRELVARFRGSTLGFAWALLSPVLMLAIYTFVFTVVFNARWRPSTGPTAEFALVLFCGLIVFTVFSEVVNRAPRLVLDNVTFVKKVVFPLEILPVVILSVALFNAVASAFILGLGYALILGAPPPTILLAPVVFLPLCVLTLGAGWLLASLGVFLRDVQQVIGIFTTAILFLSPVFYPIAAIPEPYRALLYLNPLTVVLENLRAVVFWGEWPDWVQLGCYSLVALTVAVFGYWWFMRTRRAFADVV